MVLFPGGTDGSVDGLANSQRSYLYYPEFSYWNEDVHSLPVGLQYMAYTSYKNSLLVVGGKSLACKEPCLKLIIMRFFMLVKFLGHLHLKLMQIISQILLTYVDIKAINI